MYLKDGPYIYIYIPQTALGCRGSNGFSRDPGGLLGVFAQTRARHWGAQKVRPYRRSGCLGSRAGVITIFIYIYIYVSEGWSICTCKKDLFSYTRRKNNLSEI